MEKNEKGKIVDLTKWVALALTLAGLMWGAAEFLVTKRIEAKSTYLNYQLKLYQDTAKVAAVLASHDRGSKTWLDANERFYELYWGELLLVETPVIESWMSKFEAAKEAYSPDLEKYALCLTHALRQELSVAWDVPDWAFERTSGGKRCSELPKIETK